MICDCWEEKALCAQQYFTGCLWQEDAGAGDRSKATCSTASGERAPHCLSFVPLELPYSSSSPSAGPAQPSKGSE